MTKFFHNHLFFFKILIISITLSSICIGGTIIYKIYKEKLSINNQANKLNKKIVPTISPTPTLVPRNLQMAYIKDLESPSITGSIKQLDENFGLLSDYGLGVDYFEAGKFTDGPYTGFTRILGFIRGAIMGYEPNTYIFLTEDYKKFILHGNPKAVSAYPKDDYQNPLNGLDKTKIERVEKFQSDLPDVIILNDTFALYKQSLQTVEDKNNIVPTGETNNKFKPADNFSMYQPLSSDNSFLRFYAIPASQIGGWAEQPYEQTDIDLQKQRLKYKEGVIVVDASGLSYSYSLLRLKNIKENPNLPNNLVERSRPFSSVYLHIKKEEIETDKPLYNIYSAAVPTNCGTGQDTFVVDISDNELEFFGKTTDNIDLYVLKDKNSLFYQLQLDSKPGQIYGNVDGEGKDYEQIQFYDMNDNLQIRKYPTLSEYKEQNPILFFKDPWSRWAMLGEFDYLLPGGCGKPVIYLYPETPTKVTISFLQPMKFETNIPTYQNNWTVKAYPNGQLIDLQPQYTNCNLINISKRGSEYAKEACLNNSYPYLYWSGNTFGNDFPLNINKGWYIERENLSLFMNSKLTDFGLNVKEKEDMLEYWLPEMLKKDSLYYKISFLTTKEMNKLIPMVINPRPNTVIRIFLDFLPLQDKPNSSIEPQYFIPPSRKGFTFVEWGGLKRY